MESIESKKCINLSILAKTTLNSLKLYKDLI
jgi:hypothetical protein